MRDASPIRLFLPFISRRRSEALVLFRTRIPVDAALRFLARRNRGLPRARRATLFHLLLRSLALALNDRPRLNRFTAGGRLWQRRGVWITFSAKRELTDDSPVITVKRRFSSEESFEDMVGGVLDLLRSQRSGRRTASDREMALAVRFPPFLVRAAVALLRTGNELGLLPRRFIDSDPLFCSLFVAHLGSIGLDAGYHHLWEYGTCGIFAVIGRVRRGGDGCRLVEVKYSFDERIEDGLYAAASLREVRRRIEEPESLL